MTKKLKTALIAVDIQHDFLPGGALGVADGDKTIKATLALAKSADLIVATRDWHPEKHCSFVEQGGIWPVHCVQGTKGGEIENSIQEIADVVISKAFLKEKDAYSGFEGNVRIEKHPQKKLVGTTTTLTHILDTEGVQKVVVSGLATDYCVKETALGSISNGYETKVEKTACRAVEVNPGDEEKALKELSKLGVSIN